VSNSSEEFWTIRTPQGEDISLHQWGWSVTTVGGSRYDLPPRRGSDMTLAYRPGQMHRQKLPDARQITLMMFMVGWDPATGNAPSDQRLQWNDNWDRLRRLVYRHSALDDQRVTLYRRWFLTPPQFPLEFTANGVDEVIDHGDPGVPGPGPRLLQAFSLAEMTGTMPPSMTGRFRSEFQLDFTLADPFFHGNWVSTTLHNTETVNVWNDGHDVAGPGYVEIIFKGPLTGPAIYNLSTEPNSYVRYNYPIAAGETVRLVVNKFVCQQVHDDGTTTNKIGYIQNYGSRWWLNLLPGANKLKLTALVGDGTAEIKFRPPYV
jgi:hypothetical protein